MRKLKRLRVESLFPPDGWEASLTTKVVDQIAESLEREGLREPIVVVSSGHIVHGVHRWAAAKKAGLDDIECVVENKSKSPEEHEAKVITENLDRRHLSSSEISEMLARRVDLRMADMKASRSLKAKPDPKPKRKAKNKDGFLVTSVTKNKSSKKQGSREGGVARGRPRGGEREAIRQVAKETGRSEARVQKAVHETKAKKKAVQSTHEPKPQAPTDARGQEIPENLVERWEMHRDSTDEIGKLFRAIQTKLGQMAKDSGANWTQEQGAIRQVWGRVKIRKPYAVCAWCKGRDAKCKSCNGFGFQSEAEQRNLPRELLP